MPAPCTMSTVSELFFLLLLLFKIIFPFFFLVCCLPSFFGHYDSLVLPIIYKLWLVLICRVMYFRCFSFYFVILIWAFHFTCKIKVSCRTWRGGSIIIYKQFHATYMKTPIFAYSNKQTVDLFIVTNIAMWEQCHSMCTI